MPLTGATDRPAFVRRRRRQERGAMALALVAVLFITAFSAAIVLRDVSAVRGGKLAQDRAVAVAAADAGLVDFVSIGVHQDGPQTRIATGQAGESTWEYEATRLSPGEWLVDVSGTSPQPAPVTRSITATVTLSSGSGGWTVASYRLR